MLKRNRPPVDEPKPDAKPEPSKEAARQTLDGIQARLDALANRVAVQERGRVGR